MNLTVILVIILTTVLFVLNYRMLQMKKNVTNIVDRIIAAHSRDKNFKNQEFLHYYKSNGNIWLSAMEPMFRKSLTLKAAVCVFSIVGALVMIGLAYVEGHLHPGRLPLPSSRIPHQTGDGHRTRLL